METKPTSWKIASITLDKHNHREKTDYEDLIQSIKDRGVLERIGTCFLEGDDKTLHLVWGARRLLAAKAAGLTEIPAEHYKKPLTPFQLHELRAVENLHRLDLNPIDTTIAVSSMIEGAIADGDDKATAYTRIATRLGRDIRWIRDHAFLANACGRMREWVMDGSLPLRHARELMKVADLEKREQIASWVRGRPTDDIRDDRGGGMIPASRFKEVQRHVLDATSSLRGVPWELDAKIGKLPACSTCEHNSANAMALFEHDGAEDKQSAENGKCLNTGCYKQKQAETEKLIKATITKAKVAHKKAKDEKPTFTPASIEGTNLAPAGVKLATMSRQIRGAIEPKKNGKSAPLARRSTDGLWNAKDKAHRKFYTAFDKWRRQVDGVMSEEGAASPALCVYLTLMSHLRPVVDIRTCYDKNKREKLVNGAAISRLLKPIRTFAATWDDDAEAAEDALLAEAYNAAIRANLVAPDDNMLPLIVRVLEALGREGDLGAQPDMADFFEKEGLTRDGKSWKEG